MNKNVFTGLDLVQRAGISEADLARWTKEKLVRPAGFAEDKTPLFTEEALERVGHIRKLDELGYGFEEIRKIIRKVGLPKNGSGNRRIRKKDPYLTVGGLAERSGVSPRTIKHWEDKGIIEPDMRTEGGFRLYSDSYVFLCQLIRDLQLFGYSLEEIKAVSDAVRVFVSIQAGPDAFPKAEVEAKLAAMMREIGDLYDKMKLLREGIDRWEELLKKNKKEIRRIQHRNRKRSVAAAAEKKGETHV